jgi:hypothetical protein
MYEENQSFVPESFVALYVKPGQYKTSLPKAEVMQRYELCEDLANMLQDPISAQQFQLGITEDDALKTCWQGLLVQPDLVQPAEAFWVVCRLAELLSWPMPALAWE